MLVDGHAHLYACHDPERWLDCAARNVARVSPPPEGREENGGPAGVLMLAEPADRHPFALLGASEAGSASAGAGPVCRIGRWTIRATDEPVALEAVRRGCTLLLVAGRQLQTGEGLEVLALGTASRFPRGLPLDGAVEAVREAGAVPVLPWGFGKWTGSRGRAIDRCLARERPDYLLLGDIGGRPPVGRAPRRLRAWASRGFRVLAGSDPLPVHGEEERVGAYGSDLAVSRDARRSASSVLAGLVDPDVDLHTRGARQGLAAFVSAQLRLRLRRVTGAAPRQEDR